MMGGVENVVRGNAVRAPCRLLILRWISPSLMGLCRSIFNSQLHTICSVGSVSLPRNFTTRHKAVWYEKWSWDYLSVCFFFWCCHMLDLAVQKRLGILSFISACLGASIFFSLIAFLPYFVNFLHSSPIQPNLDYFQGCSQSVLQTGCVFGTAPAQIQVLAFGLIEPHEVHVGPHQKPIKVPLNGIPSSWCIGCTICKGAEGVLILLPQIRIHIQLVIKSHLFFSPRSPP